MCDLALLVTQFYLFLIQLQTCLLSLPGKELLSRHIVCKMLLDCSHSPKMSDTKSLELHYQSRMKELLRIPATKL